MNLAFGQAGVTLGFVGALAAIITLAVGLRTRNPLVLRRAQTYVWFVAGGALLAFVSMEVALLRNDTSVKFVADHGSSKTPFPFNVATLWSALEGSILLWALVLAGYR